MGDICSLNGELFIESGGTSMIDSMTIGTNIRNARMKNGLTQRQVHEATNISQTQLSDYENGRKTPGLDTLAKIARYLKVSIDELYYGDPSISPITSAPDKGHLVANCVYQLWKENIISRHLSSPYDDYYTPAALAPVIDVREHAQAVTKLLETLADYSRRRNTYKDPSLYLEQVLDSTAAEININIARQHDNPNSKNS